MKKIRVKPVRNVEYHGNQRELMRWTVDGIVRYPVFFYMGGKRTCSMGSDRS